MGTVKHKGSAVPLLAEPSIGSAPKTTMCLSMSLTMVCNPTVGAKFAPTATAQYTDVQIGQNKFAAGDVIWNLSKGVLQVYTGSQWQDLSTRTPVGLEATGSVGTLTVATNGSTTISL